MNINARNIIIDLIDHNEFDAACDRITRDADNVTSDDVSAIMTLARSIDPTLSGPGALIRDTLRDNTDLTIS